MKKCSKGRIVEQKNMKRVKKNKIADVNLTINNNIKCEWIKEE